jgi:hypothetical protein
MSKVIRGKAYVVRDNIDTDQIIPAQYLTLVPTIPEEYEKLGSYAMCGLPKDQYPTRIVPEGQTQGPYTIVIGGRNFGCGSSREHAPIALGAAGCEAVVAESFARIFLSQFCGHRRTVSRGIDGANLRNHPDGRRSGTRSGCEHAEDSQILEGGRDQSRSGTRGP